MHGVVVPAQSLMVKVQSMPPVAIDVRVQLGWTWIRSDRGLAVWVVCSSAFDHRLMSHTSLSRAHYSTSSLKLPIIQKIIHEYLAQAY